MPSLLWRLCAEVANFLINRRWKVRGQYNYPLSPGGIGAATSTGDPNTLCGKEPMEGKRGGEDEGDKSLWLLYPSFT